MTCKLMMMNNHYFHLVKLSPWPALVALNLMNLGLSVIKWIETSTLTNVWVYLMITSLISIQWWRDVIRESLYEGFRSMKINLTISLGMIMFIISEIWLFVSFFWSYFYYSLSPDMTIGMTWPPHGIISMNYTDIPLLNTLVLLNSGLFITWAHHELMMNNLENTKTALMCSIICGLLFTMIQAYEYFNLNFSFSNSVFGSAFFILTGFHGLHVLIGLIFIMISHTRLTQVSFSFVYCFGFEYSIWYWHFVDLVWLFLYTFLYWWGM